MKVVGSWFIKAVIMTASKFELDLKDIETDLKHSLRKGGEEHMGWPGHHASRVDDGREEKRPDKQGSRFLMAHPDRAIQQMPEEVKSDTDGIEITKLADRLWRNVKYLRNFQESDLINKEQVCFLEETCEKAHGKFVEWAPL